MTRRKLMGGQNEAEAGKEGRRRKRVTVERALQPAYAYKTAVIVSMLTYEVDTACRCEEFAFALE